MDIKTSEVLRYAGYRGNEPDERTLAVIDELKAEAKRTLSPKNIYKEVGFEKTDCSIITDCGVEFFSKKLVTHLKSSERLLAFAATLGIESDRMIRKYISSDSAKAVISQALLAAAIESYCDEICTDIAAKEEKNGWYLRPRFSPGYADFELTEQKKLFSVLEITKRTGISLSDDCLMSPSKSVTAFIGLTRDKECCFTSCENCDNKDCDFRREP